MVLLNQKHKPFGAANLVALWSTCFSSKYPVRPIIPVVVLGVALDALGLVISVWLQCRRSCIDHGNGQRSFELPHKIVDGRVHAPVLHLSADQAAGGFQGLNWLVHGLQLRATHCWDLFHRIHNDWIDALQESGLLLIRLEYRNVVKLRHGPYKGQGNHEVLRSAAAEFFECCSHENVLFQLLGSRFIKKRLCCEICRL